MNAPSTNVHFSTAARSPVRGIYLNLMGLGFLNQTRGSTVCDELDTDRLAACCLTNRPSSIRFEEKSPRYGRHWSRMSSRVFNRAWPSGLGERAPTNLVCPFVRFVGCLGHAPADSELSHRGYKAPPRGGVKKTQTGSRTRVCFCENGNRVMSRRVTAQGWFPDKSLEKKKNNKTWARDKLGQSSQTTTRFWYYLFP